MKLSFKSFLAEAEFISFTPEEAAALIKRNCAQFLQESKFDGESAESTGLFRGMHLDGEVPFVRVKTSKNRKPVDTSAVVTKALDDYFEKRFGHRFRTQGIFAIGGEDEASTYGTPYLIFPIGQFSYTWSTKISDAYPALDNNDNGQDPGELDLIKHVLGDKWPYKKDSQIDTTSTQWGAVISQFLQMSNLYSNKNLPIAIRGTIGGTHPEIMVACDSYYALFYPHEGVMFDHLSSQSDFSKEVLQLLK